MIYFKILVFVKYIFGFKWNFKIKLGRDFLYIIS